MKRDWKVVQAILEHIEDGTLKDYDRKGLYRDELKITQAEFVGHLEILGDAGILKNVTVTRDSCGDFRFCGYDKAFISMAGHDLLDALRDRAVWSRIKDKANAVGINVSWEFIKAAIPEVMKELVASV